jgi:hypothetical protein
VHDPANELRFLVKARIIAGIYIHIYVYTEREP